LTKTAIIHSLHSQVADTVWNLERPFDLIISMDSHLDISLGGDADCYPKELEPYMRRTGIHMAFRYMFGGLPLTQKEGSESESAELIISISEGTFTKHAVDMIAMLDVTPEAKMRPDEDPLEYYANFLFKYFGIEVYLSPPNNLISLVPRARSSDRWLLDIDVDFMQDMQDECYTKIRNAQPGVLQYMTHVLNFIQKSNPEVITVSEAKATAMRNPKSHFSTFVSKLKSYGYRIEKGGTFDDDDDVLRRIKDCEDFYMTTSKGLLMDNMRSGGDLEEMHAQEVIKGKEFFRGRGYSF
jgi:hypothetical protein